MISSSVRRRLAILQQGRQCLLGWVGPSLAPLLIAEGPTHTQDIVRLASSKHFITPTLNRCGLSEKYLSWAGLQGCIGQDWVSEILPVTILSSSLSWKIRRGYLHKNIVTRVTELGICNLHAFAVIGNGINLLSDD